VYFEPYTRTYYWYDQGLWEEGPDLPASIRLRTDDAKVVRLQNDKPYLQHESVLSWHGSYYGALPGSTAAYHRSEDAIAQSELRAAIRLAGTMEELMELSGNFGPGAEIGDVTTTSDGKTIEGSVGAATPSSSQGSPSTQGSTPATGSGTMITGAGDSSSGTDR
jgi:hypothetical protein